MVKHPAGFVAEPLEQVLVSTASVPVFVQAQSFEPSQNEAPGVHMGVPPEEPGGPAGP
ncbi:hypothetical protein [Archangium minus]|uniref:hypothetical protein n=1 Tax=Archangium TaxID=47 RepID=UPI0037C136B3